MIISLSRNWTEILLGRANAVFLCFGFFQLIFLKEINILFFFWLSCWMCYTICHCMSKTFWSTIGMTAYSPFDYHICNFANWPNLEFQKLWETSHVCLTSGLKTVSHLFIFFQKCTANIPIGKKGVFPLSVFCNIVTCPISELSFFSNAYEHIYSFRCCPFISLTFMSLKGNNVPW